MSYYLGLDLGTSGLKGLLINTQGKVVASEIANYPISVPQVDFSEQNPIHWLRACDKVIDRLKAAVPDFTGKLSSISFSGQMHSLILVDKDGEVLHPAILWNDGRSKEECKELMKTHQKVLMKNQKNRALEGFTLPKILWIRKNEPDIWQKVAKFMMPKDYLSYYLTGRIATDYSDASGTLLLNMTTGDWDQELLKEVLLPADICPDLLYSQEKVGVLKEQLKKEYGFLKEVEIFAGGADNACAAIGAGIVSEEQGLLSIGTSGVFLRGNKQNRENEQGLVHYFHGILPRTTYIMGVTLSAGYSLSWFKELVQSTANFEDFTAGIRQIPIGSDGLLFTPYLFGERTPFFDVSKRGSFTGISATHTQNHFIRGIMEGVTFSLKQAEETVNELNTEPVTSYVVTGGVTSNKDWLQMIADVFDHSVKTLENEEGPALGAAIIAYLGINQEITLADCLKEFISFKEKVNPIPENVKAYRVIYQRFVLKSV